MVNLLVGFKIATKNFASFGRSVQTRQSWSKWWGVFHACFMYFTGKEHNTWSATYRFEQFPGFFCHAIRISRIFENHLNVFLL